MRTGSAGELVWAKTGTSMNTDGNKQIIQQNQKTKSFFIFPPFPPRDKDYYFSRQTSFLACGCYLITAPSRLHFIETSGLLRFSFHLQLRGSAGLAPASFSDGILPYRLLPYFKSLLETTFPPCL
jgi:hypothetical protein